MDVTFSAFLGQLVSNPVLAVTVFLALGAIFVNGWTDAPNAIATCVTTRCMPARAAILMSAAFNFLGVLIMTHFNASVANTISHIVDFGGNSTMALACLCAALFSIVVYGATASRFGIPTSQSHSLIAGLTGAAIALGGASSVNVHEWMKVIYGLVISTVLGFGSGWLFMRLINIIFAGCNRRKANKGFKWAQIISGAGVAILHGAQDGQKFLSLAMLGVMIAMTGSSELDGSFPLWLVLLVSLSMALGTAIGGRKIIKSVGMNMVRMEQAQGFAACLSACFCIGLATFTGMPVSTTHTNTTAIMGVGASRSIRSVKWSLAGRMVATWVLTFPGCGILAYVFTYLFLLFM